jgi:hypothetical protein
VGSSMQTAMSKAIAAERRRIYSEYVEKDRDYHLGVRRKGDTIGYHREARESRCVELWTSNEMGRDPRALAGRGRIPPCCGRGSPGVPKATTQSDDGPWPADVDVDCTWEGGQCAIVVGPRSPTATEPYADQNTAG